MYRLAIKVPPEPYIVTDYEHDRYEVSFTIKEPAHRRDIRLTRSIIVGNKLETCRNCCFYAARGNVVSEIDKYMSLIQKLKGRKLKGIEYNEQNLATIYKHLGKCPGWHVEGTKCMRNLPEPQEVITLDFSDLVWKIRIEDGSIWTYLETTDGEPFFFSNVNYADDGLICFGSDANRAINNMHESGSIDLLDIINSFWLNSFNGDYLKGCEVDALINEHNVDWSNFFDSYDAYEESINSGDYPSMSVGKVYDILPDLAAAPPEGYGDSTSIIEPETNLLFFSSSEGEYGIGEILAKKDGFFFIKDFDDNRILKIIDA